MLSTAQLLPGRAQAAGWSAAAQGGASSKEPPWERRAHLRPAYFAFPHAQGVRPKGRAGVLGPRAAPQGPHAARRKALERRGGMGFPPWGFL